MDDVALRSLLKRLEVLERTAVRARLGEVTDDSPLTVTLGGADTQIASAPALADAPLAAGDPIAALTYGNGLLVLGRVGDPPAWTAYTPTVTSVSIGTGGANVARYAKTGRTVHAYGHIDLGTGGSFTGSDISLSLPYAAASVAPQAGIARAYDLDPGAWYQGFCVAASGAAGVTFRFEGANVPLAATSPFAWTSGDHLYWQVVYEAGA